MVAVAFAAGSLCGWGASLRKARDSSAERLAQARLEHERASAEADALQLSIAHDLRSPFGAVLNFTTILELDYGPRFAAEARDILRRIRRSADNGLALLDALSRLARVGGAPLQLSPVDVEMVVRQAFAELRPPAGAFELTVGDLPPVVADAALLRAAFTELIGNAIKFSALRDKAHVSVGGRVEPGGERVYWVADDGVGFDMRFAGKLFRVFERLHSRDDFEGTGVGLAIVKRVAERHGGHVWGDGELERGARMYLALPDHDGAAA